MPPATQSPVNSPSTNPPPASQEALQNPGQVQGESQTQSVQSQVAVQSKVQGKVANDRVNQHNQQNLNQQQLNQQQFGQQQTQLQPAQPQVAHIQEEPALDLSANNSSVDTTASATSQSPQVASQEVASQTVQAVTQPQAPQSVQLPSSQSSSQSYPDLLKELLEQELISAQEAAKINDAHLSSKQSVAVLVKEADLVSEKQLVQAQAKANNIDYIDLAQTGLSPEAIDKIEESVARRYQLLPVSIDHDQQQLQVAMANPLDVAAVNFVSQKTGYQVQAAYALPSEIKRLINQRYAQDLSSNVSKAIQETSSVSAHNGGQTRSSLEQITSNSKQGGLIRAAPINKIVSAILEHAMEARASDVHIEPQTEKTRVRYRVDGVLHEKLVLPKKVHSAVVSRIKILSDLKIDEKRVPQDGRFGFSAGSQEVDLRVSTCPTIHGEKIVMRLLEKNSSVPSLSDLGISGRGLQVLRKTIHIPHGIILITGPTGSGKTTTLYSILNIINTAGVNIITLEDPVEYQIKGVSQVQVNPQAGLTFANGLRSFLRQDPDIIMVGEIRDKETADLAVQASLTGHLVFSTLHTNSAAGALPRLMDMGVEPFLLSSSVILSMGQRVVRRINPEYKEAYQPDQAKLEDIQQVLGDKLDQWCQQNETSINELKLYRTKQDRPQTEPEYKGMIGIFEVMPIDERLEKLIDQEATAGQLEEQATTTGMNLMKQDGYLKVLDGLTTIEEVLRVAEVAN